MTITSRIPAVLVLAAAAWMGCGGAGDDGPPDLSGGDLRCSACGMAVADPRYAAAIRTPEGGIAAYDAIECAVRDLRTRTGARAPAEIWLSDMPTAALRPASGMTVVLADFPSPMGGGYAAFADPSVAAAETERRAGVAGSLEQFVAGALRRPGN
ncbi:MAG: hypothetical protein AB7V45_08050 [Candidatus Krumholzibacteriia bacterium]